VTNHHKKVGSTLLIVFFKKGDSIRYQQVKKKTSKKRIKLKAVQKRF
jgi:hypothetical protein